MIGAITADVREKYAHTPAEQQPHIGRYLDPMQTKWKRLFGLAVAMWLASGPASAQFGIAPTDSLVAEFPTDSLARIFQIDFPNETSDSLGLTWRYIDGGWTEGWDVNLCDLGECYTGVPADADMLPMPAEGAGFLKLIVNALETEGTCFVHFWVWPTGNQDALVDVYFDLRNGGVNAVAEAPIEAVWQPHPNPVRAGATVTLPTELLLSSAPMQRLGPEGRLYPCNATAGAAGWILSTEGWPSGQHWIHLPNQRPVRIVVE